MEKRKQSWVITILLIIAVIILFALFILWFNEMVPKNWTQCRIDSTYIPFRMIASAGGII